MSGFGFGFTGAPLTSYHWGHRFVALCVFLEREGAELSRSAMLEAAEDAGGSLENETSVNGQVVYYFKRTGSERAEVLSVVTSGGGGGDGGQKPRIAEIIRVE